MISFNGDEVVPKGDRPGDDLIEHMRMHDVIKTADWVLDLGPGGGVNGGEIAAEGTPEAVAANERSFTGQYLKPVLAKSPVSSPAQAGVQAPKAKKWSKKPAPSKTEGAESAQPDPLAAK